MYTNYNDLQSIKKELETRVQYLRFDIENLSNIERQTKKDGGDFARLERNFPKNVSLYSYWDDGTINRITIKGFFNHNYHSTDVYLNEGTKSIDDMYQSIDEALINAKNLLEEHLKDLESLELRFEKLNKLIEQFNQDFDLLTTEHDEYILNEYARYKIRFSK